MSESEDEEIHGWVCLKTEDGKPYYYNPDLNKTQWEAPEEGFLVLDDEEVDEEQEEEEEEEEVQDYKEEQDLKHGGHVAKTHGTAAAATAIPTYDEGAPAPAASSPSLSPSAAPSSPKRRVCRWELKKTASFGAGQGEDDGDVYYLNKETGETVWEKPDDYFDDTTQTARRIVNPLAPITEETTLSEGFEVLDIYSEEAQYEVEMMKSGESTGEDCLRRLQYLDELFQNVGEEEEWFDVIMEEEYALAATVYDYFCSNCPEDVRMAVCRLLVRMSKLDEQIGIYIATERWGELSFLLNQVHSGVQYALSLPDEEEADEEEKMQSLFAWFLLVSQVFTATQDYGLPDEVLPEAAFFKPLIKAMEDCTEMVFLAACESCLAVNYHYASRDANQFMSALMAAEEVSGCEFLSSLTAVCVSPRGFCSVLVCIYIRGTDPCFSSILLTFKLKFRSSLLDLWYHKQSQLEPTLRGSTDLHS